MSMDVKEPEVYLNHYGYIIDKGVAFFLPKKCVKVDWIRKGEGWAYINDMRLELDNDQMRGFSEGNDIWEILENELDSDLIYDLKTKKRVFKPISQLIKQGDVQLASKLNNQFEEARKSLDLGKKRVHRVRVPLKEAANVFGVSVSTLVFHGVKANDLLSLGRYLKENYKWK